MTKKRRGHGQSGDPRKRPPSPTSGTRTTRRPREPHSSPEPDLLDDLDRVLAERDPLSLVQMASSILAVTDPRRQSPLEPTDPEAPTLDFLLESFADSDDLRTETLARAIVMLGDDELLRARVLRQLPVREERLPWVESLDQTEVLGALMMLDSVRDGCNISVTLRFGTGDEVTVVSYIDFNLNAALKDSFTVEASLEEFSRLWTGYNEDPGAEVGSLPLADARERLRVAVQNGLETWPPLESDTWPQSRPFLEWVLRLMPEGGTDFTRPPWTERHQAALAKAFFADPLGRPFDDRDHRDWVEALLDYRSGYGFGDPLRWSPASVEILLMDWVPRKLIADEAYLLKLPRLLTALIKFVHRQSGVAAPVSDLTLQALEEMIPAYVTAIASPSTRGDSRVAWAAENLIEGGVSGGFGPDFGGGAFSGGDMELDFAFDFDLDAYSADTGSYLLQRLEGQVGGPKALAGLDAVPLPDEPFDAGGVPKDIRTRVQSILSLAEDACDEFFDPEHATAVRRLLHDVAVNEPAIFRRRSKDETAAAALCWIIGKVNDSFHLYGSGVEVQDLMEHFGLTGSPSGRAATFVKAIDGDVDFGWKGLSTPRYLTSQTRRQFMELSRDLGEIV